MDIKVHSLWLAQDDPEKNTAVISSRRGDIILHKKINTLPKKGIILNRCVVRFSALKIITYFNEQNGSLVGLDCSWKQIEPSVEQVMRRTRLKPRMLPLFLAANPVNWGKPGKLTTIEALAAATYLVGNKEQVSKLLSGFRWGERFLGTKS